MIKKKLFIRLMLTFLIMLVGMSIFEMLKQFSRTDITIWESHIITIIFSSVLATVGAYFIIRRTEALLHQNIEEIKRCKQVEEESNTSKDFLNAVLDNLMDSLIVIDPANYSILGVNKTFLNSCGLDKDAVIGKHCYELTHNRSTPCCPPNDICPLVKTLKTGKLSTVEHIHHDSTGSKLYVEVSTMPVISKRGEIHQVTHLSKNITERKLLEKTLQLHSVIMANLAEGVYLIRASDGEILYANPRLEEMFGYGPGELIGRNVSAVNAPTERNPEETAKEIIESLNKGKLWSGEIKNIKKDGTNFWCYASVATFDHPDYGSVWVSVHTDITQRKQTEEALKEYYAKYYDLYENAPDMYFSIDVETGVIKECNETLLRTTGYSKEELIGRPVFELYDSGGMEEVKKTSQQLLATGKVHDAERRVKCKDGRIIDVSLNVSAIRDKDGNITYSRSILHDITERKKHEEMIRALSITDQLTGLYNRRGFTTLAEQQLRIAERTRNGILLLFADVDDLKQINDKLGHKSGDDAIVEASNVLKEVFRRMDIIARMGGDEFTVLAPEASLEYLDVIKDRLQDQLGIHNARAGRDYNLSLSIGIVYYDPPTPSSLDELISRADSLMYEQKRLKKPLELQEGRDA